MKKYEIINPSDKCFIYGDNVRVAKFCCLLLGNGRYGLIDSETNESVFGLHFFGMSEQEEIEEFGEPLAKFMENNAAEIVKCFNSFEYPSERTSINNIGAVAEILAKKVAKKYNLQS